MDNVFYLNDSYPLTTDVFASDGVTPALPLGATIDIVNQVTGDTVVTAGSCVVASGLATYYVLSGSTVSLTPGIYVGFMRVVLDTNMTQTIAIPFDVLDKRSYLAVDRWRSKVIDSAPDQEHISDEHGREWIDQAVNYLSRRMDIGYTSLLGTLNPAPNTNDLEFISSVASLMARSMWWAGKGNWHDGEMGFSASPFRDEWAQLEGQIAFISAEEWYDDTASADMFNRDRVFYDGVKYDSPRYWKRFPSDPAVDTEVPV